MFVFNNSRISHSSLLSDSSCVHRAGVGASDRSFDGSLMLPHPPTIFGNRDSAGSYPMWEKKVSSEGNHGPPSSTPGRSRLKQVSRGDETKDPASAEGYTHIFNKAREDRHNGGGKSPMVSTDSVDFYGQNQRANDNSKICGLWLLSME
ncbi:hypothetical protein L2E82_24648 [Cichorium intybus]|uniref:Uncharacterized protein n=1 Tax=Cichorium intybus TaxID=13427 RepID=A0ACB9E226_CICIN|nr:hypothetical protein L2E82_24648 [Cichorium intybus]